jgi:thermostable 8-oxoguanine DNA glycosylase
MNQLILSIPDFEDIKTIALFKEFDLLNKQDFLTKPQLIKILRWKSPRPLNYYLSNSEEEIKEITKLAFSTENDKLKIHILSALKGVNYPSASAVLMFYNPKIYPVLDIRVWRQLYRIGFVDTNPVGQNFTLKECEAFYQVVRELAKKLNLTARQVEKRIFDYDKMNQEGNLYK